MQRRIQTFVALTTLAITTSVAVDAEAGNRGGLSGLFSRGHLGISLQKRSSHSVFRKPVYSNRTSSHHASSHHTYSQPTYSPSQVIQQAPVQTSSQGTVASSPVKRLSPLPAANESAVVSSSRQPNTATPPTSNARTSSPPASPSTLSPLPSAPPKSAPAAAAKQPANPPAIAASSSRLLAPSHRDSEASALDLLASISLVGGETDSRAAGSGPIPQIAPPAERDAAHVGTWIVKLPGNQSVELQLEREGTFVWTATNNDNTSNFRGQYRLQNARLTLVRSNDKQQMSGSWTVRGTNAEFKLDEPAESRLEFTRR